MSKSVASHPGMAVLIDLCKFHIRAVFLVLWSLYYTHLHTIHKRSAGVCTAAFWQDRSRRCAYAEATRNWKVGFAEVTQRCSAGLYSATQMRMETWQAHRGRNQPQHWWWNCSCASKNISFKILLQGRNFRSWCNVVHCPGSVCQCFC